jgi:hypothetical protein
VWLNTITMKKLTTLYFLITASLVFGQFVDLGQKGFGGTGDDFLKRYEDTVHNTNFYVGSSNSNASFDKGEDSRGGNDIWIIKTDSINNFLWDKTIGGTSSDVGSNCIILNNKIYIIGSSKSPISGEKTMDSFGENDAWLVVLDLDGNILWQKQYGGLLNDYLSIINLLPNGNFILGGSSESIPSSSIGNKTSPNVGGLDFWLLEISPLNGDIIQQKTIGSANDDNFGTLKIGFSNNIIVKGSALEGASGDKTDAGYGNENMWVVILDHQFNILQDKCFGGGLELGYTGGIDVVNNSIFFTCTSSSVVNGNKTAPNRGSYDYWVVKTDTNLNIIWDQTYGGNSGDIAVNIEYAAWNKLVVSGQSSSGINGNKSTPNYGLTDIWFLVLNEIDGSIVSQKTYGGWLEDLSGNVRKSEKDETKLILESRSKSTTNGNKTTTNHGGYDYWMVELDASDFLATEELDTEGAYISVYPNPYSEQVNFKLEQLKEAVTLSIATLDGKIVHTQTIQPSNENIEITWKPSTTEQFLVYTIKGEKTNYTGKIVGL